MIGAMSSMYSVMQRPSPQELFAKMDTDSSEGLSAEEIEGTKLSDAIGDNFDGVDLDGNGELSHDELEALRASLEANASGEGMSGDRPPPPPPPPPSEGGAGLQTSLVMALLELDAEESEDTSSIESLMTAAVSSEEDAEDEDLVDALTGEIEVDEENA